MQKNDDDDDNGDTGSGSSTTGEPAPVWPGYLVDCKPGVNLSQVCIPMNSWDCTYGGHYTPEAICAYELGGTPADYNGLPKIVGEEVIDCSNPPTGVVATYGQGTDRCDYCRVCSDQFAGITKWEFGQNNPPGWDEWENCPTDEVGVGVLCGYLEDPTTGGPTTGDPTTGDSTTGDMGSGVWICNGSPEIFGFLQDNIPPTWQSKKKISSNIPDCVYADSVSSARDACFELCECDDTYWENHAAKNNWVWINYLCGDLFSFVVPPVEATDIATQCDAGMAMFPTPAVCPELFEANATLTILGGGTATSDDLGGFIEFDFGSCPPTGSCDVSITEVRLVTHTIEGAYSTLDVNGAPISIPFVVEELDVRLLQPVLGALNQSTGAITFPDDDFFALVSAGVTQLGSTQLDSGFDNALFVTQSANGSWDGTTLTLELEWATADGALQMSLELESQ